jgi:hypothetical protein
MCQFIPRGTREFPASASQLRRNLPDREHIRQIDGAEQVRAKENTAMAVTASRRWPIPGQYHSADNTLNDFYESVFCIEPIQGG